jgi:hypothetical protein
MVLTEMSAKAALPFLDRFHRFVLLDPVHVGGGSLQMSMQDPGH